MTSPAGPLDARLRSLLQGLDTAPGFDERVMARVGAELDAMAAQSAAQARAQEANRYELAKRGQSWGAWIRRALTLDTVGAAALAGFAIHAVPTANAVRAGEFIAVYAPQTLTVLGVLLALAALPAILLQRRRRNLQLA